MKHIMKILGILLLLLPAGLWVHNAKVHRLDLAELEVSLQDLSTFDTVTNRMVPFDADSELMGLTEDTRFIYFFDKAEMPKVNSKYRVGSDRKQFLEIGDRLFIATQEDGVKYSSLQFAWFDLNSRKTSAEGEPRLVTGDFSGNVIVQDEWLFYWYYDLSGNVFSGQTDGADRYDFKVLEGFDPETDRMGFNLTYPKLQNMPVLEWIQGENRRLFYIQPEQPPEEGREFSSFPGFPTDYALDAMLRRKASKFWLVGDELVELNDNLLNVYQFDDLSLRQVISPDQQDIFRVEKAGSEWKLIPESEAAATKQLLNEEFRNTLLEKSEEMRTLKSEPDWGAYVKSPTAIVLTAVQVFLMAGLYFMLKERKSHDRAD